MNAKQRPTKGTPLVAWEPDTTLAESVPELRRTDVDLAVAA